MRAGLVPVLQDPVNTLRHVVLGRPGPSGVVMGNVMPDDR